MLNKLTEPRLPLSGYILGLDIGEKRIGAALANVIARLPQPLDALDAANDPLEKIKEIIEKEDIGLIVIGIPRNLEGDETPQSRKIRDFAADLAKATDVPIAFADESLSSVRSEELAKQNEFKNASIDSLAACFILEEFFVNMDKEQAGDL